MGVEEHRLAVSDRDGAARFAVRVKPRASKTAILGVRESSLDLSLSSPPVDGAANEQLVEVLARALGVPRRDVSVVAGASSRSKVVEVRGLTAPVIIEKLEVSRPKVRGS